MSFGTDTFTDTATTLLTAHTPTTGNAWLKHPLATQNAQISSTNTVRVSALTSGIGATYYKNDTPPSADYSVEADMRAPTLPPASVSFGARLLARYSATALTGYEFAFAWSTAGVGTWALLKRVAGTGTNLVTAVPATVTAGTLYRMKLDVSGTTITGYVDGVAVIGPVTDSTITTAGFAGINFVGSTSPTLDVGNSAHLDNFDAIGAALPVFTVDPAVTGTASIGATLTCDGGTVTGGGTKTYQWQVSSDGGTSWSNISGATATALVVPSTPSRKYRCVVTVTNIVGTATANSNVITIPAAPVFSTVPTISPSTGPYATFDVVTGSDGVASNATTYTRQWYRGASPITGEVSAPYTLAASDEGASITFSVTATGPGGSTQAFSAAIIPAVTSPPSDANFLIYYSGGTGNTSPSASIGGGRGGTYPGGLNALLNRLPGTVGQLGGVFYIDVYVKWTHTASTVAACAAYILQQFTRVGAEIAVAVPLGAANTVLPLRASLTDPPAGIGPSDWTTATAPETGKAYGSLAPAAQRGLHIRVTINAGTAPIPPGDAAGGFVVAVSGTPG